MSQELSSRETSDMEIDDETYDQNDDCIKSSLDFYSGFSTDDSLEEEMSLNNDDSVEYSNISIEEQQNYAKIGHDENRRVNKAKTYENENSSKDEMSLDDDDYLDTKNSVNSIKKDATKKEELTQKDLESEI